MSRAFVAATCAAALLACTGDAFTGSGGNDGGSADATVDGSALDGSPGGDDAGGSDGSDGSPYCAAPPCGPPSVVVAPLKTDALAWRNEYLYWFDQTRGALERRATDHANAGLETVLPSTNIV